MHLTKIENFWMSGRCSDNFWIENGIMENMDKLGNIALEYAIFLDGLSLYEEGSPWYFWWNFSSFGNRPFFGRWGKGFKRFDS